MRYTPLLGQTLVNFPSLITFCRGLRTSVTFRFSRLCLAARRSQGFKAEIVPTVGKLQTSKTKTPSSLPHIESRRH